jgi:hypothetical protein
MITYKNSQTTKINDGYSQILREASDYFAQQRIQMIGNNFDEILSEQSLFDTYVDKLTKGLDATDAEQLSQLMENCRMGILQESSISGITPIASLSMPTIRKLWPKIALRNAVPTEPVKAPKFVISYLEPYMLDADGTKHLLPASVRTRNNNAKKKSLSTTPIALPADGYDLLTPVGGSVAVGDSVDPVFKIKSVTVIALDTDGLNPENKTVATDIRMDIRDNIYGVVSATHTDGTVTTDVILGHLNRQTGILDVASLKGNASQFVVDGTLSSENNRNTQSVSFDIKNKDVTIGTGAHINAPLPIEWLQDSMAMYQIDGALEVVDLMSSVVAQKLELEIDEFFEDSYNKAGGAEWGVQTYHGEFDVIPPTTFAGTPKEWREELKNVIDYLAIRMKNDTSFTNGKFVLFGNLLDIQLIPNVTWIFNHVTDEKGGVEVDFNIGAFAGANRFEIVATPNVPAGTIKMFYVPGTPKQMTYKYYPYTFNVEKGYIDPNRPLVPSIMMTKRHTIEELIPLVASIDILNHNGSVPVNDVYKTQTV